LLQAKIKQKKISEEFAVQSFRGAYHTIVLEKVSKKTAFFFNFFAVFNSFFQSYG